MFQLQLFTSDTILNTDDKLGRLLAPLFKDLCNIWTLNMVFHKPEGTGVQLTRLGGRGGDEATSGVGFTKWWGFNLALTPAHPGHRGKPRVEPLVAWPSLVVTHGRSQGEGALWCHNTGDCFSQHCPVPCLKWKCAMCGWGLSLIHRTL